IRSMYNEWMSHEIKELTPAGRIKRPPYDDIAEWVQQKNLIFNYDQVKNYKIENHEVEDDELVFSDSKTNQDPLLQQYFLSQQGPSPQQFFLSQPSQQYLLSQQHLPFQQYSASTKSYDPSILVPRDGI
ncbi:16122_t:CDS:2, partial [Gigaspora rosea]